MLNNLNYISELALASLLIIITLGGITYLFYKAEWQLRWLTPIYSLGILIWIFKKINLGVKLKNANRGWLEAPTSWYEQIGWQFFITFMVVGLVTYLIWKFTDRY